MADYVQDAKSMKMVDSDITAIDDEDQVEGSLIRVTLSSLDPDIVHDAKIRRGTSMDSPEAAG